MPPRPLPLATATLLASALAGCASTPSWLTDLVGAPRDGAAAPSCPAFKGWPQVSARTDQGWRERERFTARVDAGMAGARATAAVLAGLPVLGIGLGVGTALLVNQVSPLPTVVAWWSVLLAFGVSVAVGVFFGVAPARRAGRLDALRELIAYIRNFSGVWWATCGEVAEWAAGGERRGAD